MEPIKEESESPNSASPTSRLPDNEAMPTEVSIATELENAKQHLPTIQVSAMQEGATITGGNHTELSSMEAEKVHSARDETWTTTDATDLSVGFTFQSIR